MGVGHGDYGHGIYCAVHDYLLHGYGGEIGGIKMPRVALSLEQKKAYKVKDFKGWVCHQMKLSGKNQTEVAKALGISQPRLSGMLKIPKKGERVTDDPFTYGDLLTLCELFSVSDEEKIRLLTL